jgi:pimeloyl-ACP methyl ester carboxylesterase
MINKFAVFPMMLCAAALSSTPQLQAQKSEVTNIVLVHGAWADGSGWKGVHNFLVKDGFNVSIVQEPETSFQDDVTAVKRILALQDGPTILVAHSYAGSVITEAGTDPTVAGLVYVAAHMPDAGENEADDGKRLPSEALTTANNSRNAGDIICDFMVLYVPDVSLRCIAMQERSWLQAQMET